MVSRYFSSREEASKEYIIPLPCLYFLAQSAKLKEGRAPLSTNMTMECLLRFTKQVSAKCLKLCEYKFYYCVTLKIFSFFFQNTRCITSFFSYKHGINRSQETRIIYRAWKHSVTRLNNFIRTYKPTQTPSTPKLGFAGGKILHL